MKKNVISGLISLLLIPNLSYSQNTTDWTQFKYNNRDGVLGYGLFLNEVPLQNQKNSLKKEVYKRPNDKNILIFAESKERVFEEEYDQIEIISENDIKVKNNGKYGIVDLSGKIIIPLIYDDITPINPDIFIGNPGDRDYDLSYFHPEILLFQCFKNLSPTSSNIKEKKQIGVINRNNKEVIPFTKEGDFMVDKVYFFKKKNEFYTVYVYQKFGIVPGKNYSAIENKFSICKLGETPNKFYQGNIREMNRLSYEEPFKIKVVMGEEAQLEKIFDLEKEEFITDIEPFRSISQLSKNYFVSTKFIGKVELKNLISKDFKIILPYKYLDINILHNQFHIIDKYISDNTNITPNLYDTEFDLKDQIKYYNLEQYLEKDSLLLISSSAGVGIYKIGVGEILPPNNLKIFKIENSEYCVVQYSDKTYNIVELKNFKKVFPTNYDEIFADDNGTIKFNKDGKETVRKLDQFNL